MSKKLIKYGLLTYPGTPKYNVGDYVQSLAAKQFLPNVDKLINREALNRYEEEDVKMIMNGWYMHNSDNFKPTDKINPLYISFHLNSRVKDLILNNQDNVDYLKKNAPIGCRDFFTLESLKSKGIDAYFSSCLTTTLGLKYKSEEKNDKVYFADVIWNVPNPKKLTYGYKYFAKSILKGEIFQLNKRKNILNKVFDNDVLDKQENVDHYLPKSHNEERRFKEAELFLDKLSKAELVVTSRIHAALPCLAMGTPVVFINYGFERLSDQSRFRGIVDFFNTININLKGELSANFDLPDGKLDLAFLKSLKNPTRHLEYVDKLKEKCTNFINN